MVNPPGATPPDDKRPDQKDSTNATDKSGKLSGRKVHLSKKEGGQTQKMVVKRPIALRAGPSEVTATRSADSSDASTALSTDVKWKGNSARERLTTLIETLLTLNQDIEMVKEEERQTRNLNEAKETGKVLKAAQYTKMIQENADNAIQAAKRLALLQEQCGVSSVELAHQTVAFDLSRELVDVIRDPEGVGFAVDKLVNILGKVQDTSLMIHVLLNMPQDSIVKLIKALLDQNISTSVIPLRADSLISALMAAVTLKNLGSALKPAIRNCIENDILTVPRKTPREIAEKLLSHLKAELDKTSVTKNEKTKREFLRDLFIYMGRGLNDKFPGKEVVYLANFLCLRVINFMLTNPKTVSLAYPPPVPPAEHSPELQVAVDVSKVLMACTMISPNATDSFQDSELAPLLRDIVAFIKRGLE